MVNIYFHKTKMTFVRNMNTVAVAAARRGISCNRLWCTAHLNSTTLPLGWSSSLTSLNQQRFQHQQEGPEETVRVCVVGSGPAGFYTAKYTLKQLQEKGFNAHVDMLEALPTPFGLVRSGVAPDHPEVKAVQNDFTEVAQSPSFRFFGNMRLGENIHLSQLRDEYSAVVLAYGAESDRRLGIEGEDLNSVISAREFVNWYNGHPSFASLYQDGRFNLSTEDVAIVGNGNVALDCARILLKPLEELQQTDIAEHAEEALKQSNVRRVHILGRRGHNQAAFTIKELRELTRIKDTEMIVLRDEMQQGKTEASEEEVRNSRAKRRIEELLEKHAHEGSVEDAISKSTCRKQCLLRFLRSPDQISQSESSNGSGTSGIYVRVSQLTGPAGAQQVRPTDTVEFVRAGLILKSIGYSSTKVDEVPFNEREKVVPSERGRVLDQESQVLNGVYVAGWLKRGPSGIIGTNITDAKETTNSIVEDASQGSLPLFFTGETDLFRTTAATFVDWSGWKRIDEEEASRGEKKNKLRSKIVDFDELLSVASQR